MKILGYIILLIESASSALVDKKVKIQQYEIFLYELKQKSFLLTPSIPFNMLRGLYCMQLIGTDPTMLL